MCKQFIQKVNSSEVRIECLVIGSGAGGSVIAYELANAGKEVLILEEGPFFSSEDFNNRIGMLTQNLYRNGGISPFIGAPPIAFTEGCCVGGGTTINGALIWRTPYYIFDEWKKFKLTGYNLERFNYHFKKIEKLMNVTHKLPGAFDNLDSVIMEKSAKNLSWKVVTVPRGLKNCTNINRCATGCPSRAKQSTVESYLKFSFNKGTKILPNTKVKKLYFSNRKITSVECYTNSDGRKKKIIIKPEVVFLAAGAIQTPFLLNKSKISNLPGKSLQFHLNIKVVALFDQKIMAQNGTIFTHQVQEFDEKGLLFMASNWQPHYASLTLSHFKKNIIKDVLGKFDYSALYVIQIRSKSIGNVKSLLGSQPIVFYKFNSNDLKLIKEGLKKFAKLMFNANAKKLYLPIRNSRPVSNYEELNKEIGEASANNFELLSVHAMSSCAMSSSKSGIVNLDGKVKSFNNLYVADASILPSNLGESPQGTIMAFAHEISERYLNK